MVYVSRAGSANHLFSGLRYALLLLCILQAIFPLGTSAEEETDLPRIVTISVSSYRFHPNVIDLVAGQHIVVRLTNDDLMTHHGFTVQYPEPSLQLNAEVPAQSTIDVELWPRAVGNCLIYCDKEPFLSRSHRARGMQGLLKVRE